MAGISSKAAGKLENKKKYNGIEFENDFDLNTYDAFFRELDPQIGRWWQIDPKIENMESWSPYVSNFDNPISFYDPLGDEPDGDDKKKKAIKNAQEKEAKKKTAERKPKKIKTPPATVDYRFPRKGLDGVNTQILDPRNVTGVRKVTGNQEPDRADGKNFTSKYGQPGAGHVIEKNRTLDNQQPINIDMLMFTAKFADKLKSPVPTVSDPWDWVKFGDKLYGIEKLNSTSSTGIEEEVKSPSQSVVNKNTQPGLDPVFLIEGNTVYRRSDGNTYEMDGKGGSWYTSKKANDTFPKVKSFGFLHPYN